MKKIFKYCITMLLICLLFTFSLPIYAFSSESFSININKSSVVVDEIFNVMITLSSEKPMYGISCNVFYDSSLLEYKSGKASGGAGVLRLVEAPNGVTEASYTLNFKAISNGECKISLRDCSYAILGANGAETKEVNDTSVAVTIVSNYVSYGTCGEGVNWTLDTDGVLNIIGEGAVNNYGTPEETPWYDYSNIISSIIVGEEISYIGHNCFNTLSCISKIEFLNPNTEISQYYVFSKLVDIKFISISGFTVEKYANNNNYVFIDKYAPDAPTIKFINKDTVELECLDNFEYSIDGVNWQRSNIFNNLKCDTVLNFYQRLIPSGIDINSPKSFVTKAIIVSAPKVLVGEKSLKFVPVEGYQYSINGKKFQEDNTFIDLIPNWNYTVYQEPIDKEDLMVYYIENSVTVCTNGFDKVEQPNSTHLSILRKNLFAFTDYNMLGADFNSDNQVNILDYVYLKKYLLNN